MMMHLAPTTLVAKRRRWAALSFVAGFALLDASPIHADCALISTAVRRLESTLGASAQPFASPGRDVLLFNPVQCEPSAANFAFDPDPPQNRVEITFVPDVGGPFPPLTVDPTTVEIADCNVEMTRCTTLRFPMPSTGMTGPARIDVENLTTGQTVAQIDELFEPTVSCEETNRVANLFRHFTVLPADNAFTPGATQSYFGAPDGSGTHILVPVDWSAALVAPIGQAQYRIVSATSPIFTVLPGGVQAFDIVSGQPLPPIIQISDTGDTVTGSIDFPFSVIRLALTGLNFVITSNPIEVPGLAQEASAAGPLNSLSPAEDLIGVARDEALESSDLTGDVDLDDRAAAFIDRETGLVVDTGIAVLEARRSPAKAILETEADLMAFCQSEAHQGRIPVNGDGDVEDCVVRMVRSDGSAPAASIDVTADPSEELHGAGVFGVSNDLAFFVQSELDDAPSQTVHASPDAAGQFGLGESTNPSLTAGAAAVAFEATGASGLPPAYGDTVLWETATIPGTTHLRSVAVDDLFVRTFFEATAGDEEVPGLDLSPCTTGNDGFQLSHLQTVTPLTGTYFGTLRARPASCFQAQVPTDAGTFVILPGPGGTEEEPFVPGTVIRATGPIEIQKTEHPLPGDLQEPSVEIILTALEILSQPDKILLEGEIRLFARRLEPVGVRQVFRHDLGTGATVLASQSAVGGASNADALRPSAAGPWVAFASAATNLDPTDGDSNVDVFVHDVVTGATTLESGDSGSSGDCDEPSLAADGSALAFTCDGDVFVRTLPAGPTTRITTQGASFPSSEPRVNGDGSCLVFTSEDPGLIPGAGDANGAADIFLWEEGGTLRRISIPLSDPETDGASTTPSVSDDCRYVAFRSAATNLVDPSIDLRGAAQCYSFDVLKGDTQLVSATLGGDGADADCAEPTMSADARYVGFRSAASNLGGGLPSFDRTWRADRITGIVTEVSLDLGGVPASSASQGRPSLSANGRAVAFATSAPLDPVDPNGASDIYLRSTDPAFDPNANGAPDDRLLQALRVDTPVGALIPSDVAVDEVSPSGNRALFIERGTRRVGLFTPMEVPAVVLLPDTASAVALGEQVACVISESGQLLVADPSAFASGLTTTGAAADAVQAVGDRCVFTTPESVAGDLDGDGLATRSVVQVWDPAATPALVNTARAALDFEAGERAVCFRRPEGPGSDGNGDLDAADAVMECWEYLAHSDGDSATDPLIETLRAARRCTFPGCDPFFEPYRIVGNMLSFVGLEPDGEAAGGTGAIAIACLPGAPAGVCDLTGDGLGGDFAVTVFSLDSRQSQIFPIPAERGNQVIEPPFADEDGTIVIAFTDGTSIAGDQDGDGTLDTDGVTNPAFSTRDNCSTIANAEQVDGDQDLLGAACETDDANAQDRPGSNPCDLDKNGVIDANDVGQIFADRGAPLPFFDFVLGIFLDDRNPDGDGVISALDARACALLCDEDPADCFEAMSPAWEPPPPEIEDPAPAPLCGLGWEVLLVVGALRLRQRRLASKAP